MLFRSCFAPCMERATVYGISAIAKFQLNLNGNESAREKVSQIVNSQWKRCISVRFGNPDAKSQSEHFQCGQVTWAQCTGFAGCVKIVRCVRVVTSSSKRIVQIPLVICNACIEWLILMHVVCWRNNEIVISFSILIDFPFKHRTHVSIAYLLSASVLLNRFSNET